MDCEQLLAYRSSELRHHVPGLEFQHLEKDLAGQGVSVGMQPRRRQTDQHIAGLDSRSIHDLSAIDDPDNETGGRDRHEVGAGAQGRAVAGLYATNRHNRVTTPTATV